MAWLSDAFVHPMHVQLDSVHHLRPIRASDADIDYAAVMSSRERLWRLYGDAWGWPPATMTLEQDRVDLSRHEQEQREQISFNYAILNAEESTIFGCVYIDPPHGPAEDAVISWWVVDEMVGSDLDRTLSEFVPKWILEQWGFAHSRYGV